jgi:hypothetical protein
MKNIEIVFLADTKYFKLLNELIDSYLSFKKKERNFGSEQIAMNITVYCNQMEVQIPHLL